MAWALLLISWWTGVDFSGGSLPSLEVLSSLTPKMLAFLAALL